jgi:hypothetical protein
VKTPDPAGEPSRRVAIPRIAEPGPHRSEEREEEEFRPKYLSMPMRRSRGHGFRNLTWGVALLAISAMLFAWGLYLAGPGAAYTVAVSLATAATLYVLARARLFRQRNGNFLAGAIVCLLAVGFVLVQGFWMRTVDGRSAPAVAAATDQKPSGPATASAEPPALLDQFKPSPSDLDLGEVAEVLKPTTVNYKGKSWLLRPGELVPVSGMGVGEVRLAIGNDEVKVPSGNVKLRVGGAPATDDRPVFPPGGETAGAGPGATGAGAGGGADATQSQKEATRRYPALAVKGSPENESCVAAVQELKFTGGGSFFEDPDWPMRLAEMLATREGWTDSEGNRRMPKPTAEEPGEPSVEPRGAPPVPGGPAPVDATGRPANTAPVDEFPEQPARRTRE